MAAEENWSNLPGELVEKVAEFVTSYGDYIRARAVCLSWLSALPKTPNHLPTQFPLLMLPGGTGTHKDLFSLAENKSYRLEFPSEIHYNSICGSCHGWLVVKNGNSSLALFNPFTKAHIHLPSLGLGVILAIQPQKFVLSSSPSSSDFMAIALSRYSRRLWFYRCEDKRWTEVHVPDVVGVGHALEDAIFYKNQIVALSSDREVIIMDIIRDDKNSTTEINTRQIVRAPYPISPYYGLYLAESEDELLIIRQFHDFRDECDRIILFAVYRLDWNKSRTGFIEAKWSEVKSLDNKMFFLGMGPSSYFSSSDFHGCRGNSLYFVDDLLKNHSEGDRCGGNVAMFDLGDRRTKPLPCYPQGPPVFLHLPAIWLTPSPV